jgi:hypothetical protein
VRLRRLTAASIAVLLLGVAAIGWIVWRARPEARAEPLGLTVLVNHGSRVEVTPGTPLFFEVSITNSPSSGAQALGSRWRPWYRLIRLEGSGQAGMPWRLSRAGPPRSLRVVRTPDGRPEMKTDTEPSAVARLEAGRQVYTVTEVASPEAAAGVRPGAYRVRAVLETPRWMLWGWRGRKVSQPVTIVVLDASKPGDKRDALERQRLARAADFYIGAEQFADAERTVRQLLELEPNQAEAHMLLGDSLAGLNRRDDALVAYRRALVLTPRSYEEPRVLMDRIERQIANGKSRQ